MRTEGPVPRTWLKPGFICLTLLLLAGCGGAGPSTSSTTAANTTAPNGQPGTTSANLQEISGWQSCTALLNGQVCASGLGNATYSMGGPVISPSLDDNATQFQIGGPTPYSNALWWKQLTPHTGAHHFLYDLWFYLTETGKSQSLEFDVNQSIGTLGKWFVFGTQCNFKDSHQWDVWDGSREMWQPTQVPFPPVSASTWHHLVLEFQRTDAGEVTFLSVTLDDEKSQFNQSFVTSRTSNVDVSGSPNVNTV